jgi:hypothetical protein
VQQSNTKKAHLNNSSTSTRIITALLVNEGDHQVRQLFAKIGAEIESIEREGIHIDGIHYTFEFYLTSDYKMLELLFGLGGASATYCCIYCLVEQRQLLLWEEFPLRSLEDMKNFAHPLVGLSEKEIKKLSPKHYSQKYSPILNLSLDRTIVDILHLKMNMGKKFEDIRRRMMQELSHDESLKEAKKSYKKMKINRKLTGLNGKQTEKIFDDIEEFSRCVAGHSKYEELKKCMRDFWQLFDIMRQHIVSESQIYEFEYQAPMWGERMKTHFGEYIQRFVYLHVFVMHGGRLMRRFGGLSKWSCEGFEHVNHVMKELKFKSTNHGGGKRKQGSCMAELAQAAKKVNAKGAKVGKQVTNKQTKCSICKQTGHNKITCNNKENVT